ncbi:hypothetical protein ACO0R3_001053 [Hanseniaspora guilliermondii]
MFKHTINILQRNKDNSSKKIKFKRVLKNINHPDEKLKADILFHSFFNKYANHPIPIRSLTDPNLKTKDKLSFLENIDDEQSGDIVKNGLILSMIKNELPLFKLFNNTNTDSKYNLDNSLLQLLKKAKSNKDENIVAHAKMKPFTPDFKLDKAKYFEECKKLNDLKNINHKTHTNIYTFHPDNIEAKEDVESKIEKTNVSQENISSKFPEENHELISPFDKLVYKNLGKTKRAEIALKRFAKKHKLDLDARDIDNILKPTSKFNFQNNYFKIKGKNILVPNLNLKKHGVVYCWELTHKNNI